MKHIHIQETLPDFPIVEVEESDIYITMENGDRHYWGKESSPESASDAAIKMELELKAIEYTKKILAITVEELMETQKKWGLDKDVNEILFLSHRQFIESQKFTSLDQWLMITSKRFKVKCLEIQNKYLTKEECHLGLNAINELQNTLRTLKGVLIAEGARRVTL